MDTHDHHDGHYMHEHEQEHDHGHHHDQMQSQGHVHTHGHEHHHDLAHSHGVAAAGLPADQVAECPVMPGNLVVRADAEAAGLFRDFEGTRYYLCCAACVPKFDAEPARYATAP